MASKQPKEPEHTFETAIERLEQIVEEMESDKLPLERLLERYEEGTKLVKVCQEKLDSAERRIEIITRNAAGKPQLSDFEPAASAPAAPSSLPAVAKPAPKAAPPEDDEISLF
ncbi:exodeoxyribonuclease VII small subunit [Verrucomicrobiota bacterium sgz303538]